MANAPEDELDGKRRQRERARQANRLAAIDDQPNVTEQDAAIARARESLALSRPSSGQPAMTDQLLDEDRHDERP